MNDDFEREWDSLRAELDALEDEWDLIAAAVALRDEDTRVVARARLWRARAHAYQDRVRAMGIPDYVYDPVAALDRTLGEIQAPAGALN